MKKKTLIIVAVIIIGIIVALLIIGKQDSNKTIRTNSGEVISNKKIGWGIRRNDNHNQPDLGRNNKKLIDENEDIAMGNTTDKYVYLTFDEGYEAGYTPQILDILKENNVKAAFFITGHYLNTQPELVERMIEEGHIVGNQLPPSQMYRIWKNNEN